jgi:hypothetical protein
VLCAAPEISNMVDFAKDQAFMDWLKGIINGLIAAGGGGSGSAIGNLRATAALAAGANHNLNPGGGWPTNYGRLFLTAAGAANVTGLVAGVDNQWVLIVNDDAVNNITLNASNAGSAAANQFDYASDLILPPLATVVAIYDSTELKWVLR